MSNKVYDILSKIQRWLPACGVFYLALCAIWGLPFGDEVNATIVAIATFLGATLEIACSNYRKKVGAELCESINALMEEYDNERD